MQRPHSAKKTGSFRLFQTPARVPQTRGDPRQLNPRPQKGEADNRFFSGFFLY